MTCFEYKVVPAPSRGQRGKRVKGADGKFANALESAMNQMAADGWEYQRAETLPCEERAGLTGKTTTYRNVLVFRRPQSDAMPAPDTAEAPAEPQTPEPRREPALTQDVAQPEGDDTVGS